MTTLTVTRPLSPRERQTLLRLLAGDSEKEAARILGCSRHTLHMYVKSLYRYFGVETRSQLMAMFIGRESTPRFMSAAS